MPESRRAGRLSGEKEPPLASAKRGALPPGPPILPQTRFITGNGQPYGCPFPVSRRDNDVILLACCLLAGQCAGRLMRRNRGGTGFVRKRFFVSVRRGRVPTPPSSVMSVPWRPGGCPARHPKTGTRHTDQSKSFWEERGSMRGRGDLFSKRSPLPLIKKHCPRAAIARVVY